MGENSGLTIDWSKFKSNAKGKELEKVKNGYIGFCEMLNEVDFELVTDYAGSHNKIGLMYKFDNNIKLNIKPKHFKTYTYKSIINFKNNTSKNGDSFIKFVNLTNGGNLIAKIKTFDNGEIDIDIGAYGKFIKSREGFYNKLKEVNGYTTDYYKDNGSKINIYIDDVKLNPMKPHNFKNQTYKSIIKFKKELEKNEDEFIKFVGLSGKSFLISQIKTFDGGEFNAHVASYSKFNEGRQDIYNYCEEKGYKILSPYLGNVEKMLIDFNCEHEPHWITSRNLKQNQGCPICNQSKGEKSIRLYLENNNIKFKQEYKFEKCKYKKELPFDFYIPKYNSCIEFDGIQHFEIRNHFGKKEFELTQKRDKIKDNYCSKNGINLLRIPYWELDSVEDILDEEFKRLSEGFIKDNIA